MSDSVVARRLLGGGLAAMGFRLTGAVLSMATAMLVTRALTPAAVGAFMLGTVLVTFLSAAAMLGLENTMVRRIAQALARDDVGRPRAVIRGALDLIGIAVVLGGSTLVIAREPLLADISRAPALAASAVALVIWIGAQAFELAFASALRGMHRLVVAATFQTGFLRGLLQLTGVAALVATHRATLPHVLWVAAAAAVSAALLAGLRLRIALADLDRGGVSRVVPQRRALIAESWPLMMTTILTYGLSQLDLWLAARYAGAEAAGVYGTMLRLTFVAALPLLVLNATAASTIADLAERQDFSRLQRHLRTLATVAALATTGVVILFLLVGAPLVRGLFGPYYMVGTPILIVLSLGQLVNVATGSCGMTLMMTGRQQLQLTLSAASVVLLLASGAYAGARWGALGIAVASAVTVAVNNVATLAIVRWRVGIFTHSFLTPSGIMMAVRDVMAHALPLLPLSAEPAE